MNGHTEVEAKLLKDFEAAVLKTFNLEVTAHSIYEHHGEPSISMWINLDEESPSDLRRASDIRLALRGPNGLNVGWGGSTLLTTNSTDRWEQTQIKQIIFVAKLFTEEAKWRDVLGSIEIGSLVAEKEAEAEASRKAIEAKMQKELQAFTDANIVVGTTIAMDRSTGDVVRMTATKVQIGKYVHDKHMVGAKLLEGKWLVKK